MRSASSAVRSIAATAAFATMGVWWTLSASSASADTISAPDQRGDLFEEGWGLAPRQRDPDITLLNVDHRARAVVVTARYRDLTTGGHHSFKLNLVTADRRYRADGNTPFPSTTGELENSDLSSGEDTGLCPRMTGAFDYEESRLRVRIPRACLDTPAWVRASLYVRHITAPDVDGDTTEFYDTTAVTTKTFR